MLSVSFERDNVEQIRRYLKSKGLEVSQSVKTDGAKNEVIAVTDPSRGKIKFIEAIA